MERERLTRLLEEPARVAREDLAGLRALTERYPWFSAAHLLLAMGEHASGALDHAGTLRTTAAHLPTRSLLFDTLGREGTEVVSASTPMLAAMREELPVVVPAREDVPKEEGSPAAPAPTVPNGTTATEDGAAPGDAAITGAPALQEPFGQAPPKTVAEADPLDAEIRRAAAASSYAFLVEHARADALPEAVPPSITAPPPATDSLDPTDRTAPPAPAPVIPPGGRLSFTAWLDLPSNPPAPPTPAHTAPAPPAASTSVSDLIDRFIHLQTPDPRPKAEFFDPHKAGKRSLDDSTGLVTETLARIYEQQGNLQKAIDTYRRLALKHPDKSAYFAALEKALLARLTP
jgi:hypothetical protein